MLRGFPGVNSLLTQYRASREALVAPLIMPVPVPDLYHIFPCKVSFHILRAECL